MNIKNVQEMKYGEQLVLEGLVKQKEAKQKRNGDKYLQLTIVDSSGEMTFPVWEKVDERDAVINEGDIVKVVGNVGSYGGKNQIVLQGFSTPETTDRTKFISSYDRESYKFKNLAKYIVNKIFDLEDYSLQNFICHYLFNMNFQELVGELISPAGDLLDDEGIIDFFNEHPVSKKLIVAPAAVHHHQNKLGGLLIHTCGVLANAINIMSSYLKDEEYDSHLYTIADNVIDRDLVIVGAILHDIQKIEEYTYDVMIERDSDSLGHRLLFMKRSQSINDNYKDLSEERLTELQELILTHHGPWGGQKPKNINSVILFCADYLDSQIASCAENNTTKTNMSLKSMIDAE